jgi:hypothetical protein
MPLLDKSWLKSHKQYVKHLTPNNAEASVSFPDDETSVAFLGQSMIEVLNGRINGSDPDHEFYFGRVHRQFQKRFQYEDTPIKGIALGLSGESSADVLWRLMHGELPDSFDPPIWWLVLGMEDVAKTGCSEEVTIMVNLRCLPLV